MLNSSLILHLNQLLLLNGFYSLIIIISSVYSDLPSINVLPLSFLHNMPLLISSSVNVEFFFNPSLKPAAPPERILFSDYHYFLSIL